MTIALYDTERAPSPRRVRLLAAELGLALTRRPIDVRAGDNRTPQYLALNPNGSLPTLDDDGFVLWESAAIMKRLAAKVPERGFLPADPDEAARLDQWLFWWVGQPEAAMMLLIRECLAKRFLGLGEPEPAVKAFGEEGLARTLPVLEAECAGREFLLGELGIFDFFVAPPLEFAFERLGVATAPYPHLAAWLARMQARPYWKTA